MLSEEEQGIISSPKGRSISELITDFEHTPSAQLQRIEAFPTVAEMKKLTELNDEVMIIISEDDKVFAVKGNKRIEKDSTLLPQVL